MLSTSRVSPSESQSGVRNNDKSLSELYVSVSSLELHTEGIDMYVLYFQGLLLSLSPLRSGGCVVPNGGKDVCELKHVVFDRCFRSHIS